MNLLLGISNNQVRSIAATQKDGPRHFYNDLYIYKGARGWYYNASGFDYFSAENDTVSEEVRDVMTGFEFKAHLQDSKHYRQEGIYEVENDTKIVVINNTNTQTVEITGRNIDTFRRALVALRNGEIHPKYPLVRKQESPTYDSLAETVSEQTKTIRRLVEQLETATKVVNHAQQLILEASEDFSKMNEKISQLEVMFPRLERALAK